MKALFAKSNMKVISLLIPLLLILVYKVDERVSQLFSTTGWHYANSRHHRYMVFKNHRKSLI